MKINLVSCPRCQSSSSVKDGIVRKKQRFLCKSCNFRYTLQTILQQKSSRNTRRKALILYLEGFGYREIGRMLNVSHVSIQNWIKEFEMIEKLRCNNKPELVEQPIVDPKTLQEKVPIGNWLLVGISKDLLLTYWIKK
jgi:transposase-like protein